MAYMHILNLYKDQTILNKKYSECYVLEKVHGTSANIKWKDGKIIFSSGGENHTNFIKLFNEQDLVNKLTELKLSNLTIFGEAYGGKQQGMKDTYGNELKFIVFDIQIGDTWLDVPSMDRLATELKLEVVPWYRVKLDVETLNKYRDAPSEVAKRRGIKEDRIREGIVIRPLEETTNDYGERLIVKHKGEKFNERATTQIISPEAHKVLEDANAIANEWVVEERLNHVIDHVKAKLQRDLEMKDVPLIIKDMLEDIEREAKDEIIMSKEAKGAIGKRTASLFKKNITKI